MPEMPPPLVLLEERVSERNQLIKETPQTPHITAELIRLPFDTLCPRNDRKTST